MLFQVSRRMCPTSDTKLLVWPSDSLNHFILTDASETRGCGALASALALQIAVFFGTSARSLAATAAIKEDLRNIGSTPRLTAR
jgi:hypothetical protein